MKVARQTTQSSYLIRKYRMAQEWWTYNTLYHKNDNVAKLFEFKTRPTLEMWGFVQSISCWIDVKTQWNIFRHHINEHTNWHLKTWTEKWTTIQEAGISSMAHNTAYSISSLILIVQTITAFILHYWTKIWAWLLLRDFVIMLLNKFCSYLLTTKGIENFTQSSIGCN